MNSSSTPRSLFVIGSLAIAAWVSGCATADTTDDVLVAPEENVDPQTTPPTLPGGPTGPQFQISYNPDSTACPTWLSPAAMQKRVTGIVTALAGGPTSAVLNTYPCTGPNADPAAVNEHLNNLKAMLATYYWPAPNDTSIEHSSPWNAYSPDQKALLGGTQSINVCGIPAVARSFVAPVRHYKTIGTQQIPIYGEILAVASEVNDLGKELNKCWGEGARAFTLVDTTSHTVLIDPGAATVTYGTGAAGTTADGSWVNGGGYTGIIRWPTTLSAGNAVAGMPCWPTTLGPLPAGGQTSMIIVQVGSLKKCQ